MGTGKLLERDAMGEDDALSTFLDAPAKPIAKKLEEAKQAAQAEAKSDVMPTSAAAAPASTAPGAARGEADHATQAAVATTAAASTAAGASTEAPGTGGAGGAGGAVAGGPRSGGAGTGGAGTGGVGAGGAGASTGAGALYGAPPVVADWTHNPLSELPKRPGLVAMQGNPLTLLGRAVAVGDPAPDFQVLSNGFAPVSLKSFPGRTLLICAVPSLETPVCDLQIKRFNEEAKSLPKIKVLCVSMDLPFAQRRWCEGADVWNVTTVSDFQYASFGKNWGLLTEEMGLLARAIYIVDPNHRVTYCQIVKDLGEHPDFVAAVLAAQQSV